MFVGRLFMFQTVGRVVKAGRGLFRRADTFRMGFSEA